MIQFDEDASGDGLGGERGAFGGGTVAPENAVGFAEGGGFLDETNNVLVFGVAISKSGCGHNFPERECMKMMAMATRVRWMDGRSGICSGDFGCDRSVTEGAERKK